MRSSCLRSLRLLSTQCVSRARTRVQNTLDRAILAASDLDQPLPADEVVDDYFRKALEVFVEIADSFEVSNAANNLGNINLELRKYTDAIQWYVRSARIDESLGNMRGLATGYHNISHIYKEIGDFDQALEYSNSA